MQMKYDFGSWSKKKSSEPRSFSLQALDQAFPDFDALILTSKDAFMSEYVPLENNPRYGVTGFTGSVGDCIYWTEKFRKAHPGLKPVSLFVDGRYHLQADRETLPAQVEVVKLDIESNIEASLRDRFSQYGGLKVGIDFERTALASLDRFRLSMDEHDHQLLHIQGETVLAALMLLGWRVDREVFSLPESATGRSLKKNLDALSISMQQKGGAQASRNLHLTCTSDDAAFLLNARAYHLPHTGSLLAYTFFIEKELILFFPACSKNAPVNLDQSGIGDYRLTIIRDDVTRLKKTLAAYAVEQVFFLGSTLNALLPSWVQEIFPAAKLNADFDWIRSTRVRKTEAEMNSIRSSFLRSSKAIAKTLRFGKSESQKRKVSEVELANFLYQAYAEAGAVELSFKTISGAGPHSAIVHYSTPSETQYFEKGMLALLDSGAYYEEGFCTDCTRGFFVGGDASVSGVKPEAWQKEIYTTCLKSAIQVFLQPIEASLSGKEVDAWIRKRVKDAGFDYAHGTGHGIGIHVHEEGIRLSTASIYPQTAFACVSVEPGIYLQNQGGVRVENVALLIPEGKTHFRYENVVWVGYDWDLIDLDLLTENEKKYLAEYEAACRKLGTELTSCPLVME